MINPGLFNPEKIRETLEEVAKQVEGSDKLGAERLEQLADAVDGSKAYADAWAASDIHQVINAPAIIEHFRNQPIKDAVINIVELCRNVLIFAPLVVTWFGISSAVAAYGRLVSDNPEAEKVKLPFILLWEQGFDGRLQGYLSFSFIAATDFILLLIVLVLTAIASYLSSVARQKREREALNLTQELNHALTGARLCLTTKNWAQPTNFVTRFDQAIASFKTVVSELVEQIKGERVAIETLAERQSEETKLFSTFKTELRTSMDGVSRSVSQMQTATTGLDSGVKTLLTSINTLTTPVGRLVSQQDTFIQDIQRCIALFKSQVDQQQQVTNQQEQWGETLQDVLKTLQKTVERSVNEGGELATTVKDLHSQYQGYLDTMHKEHDAQRELTNNIYDAAAKLESTVRVLDNWHTELSGINVQMTELIDRLGDFSDRFTGHLSRP